MTQINKTPKKFGINLACNMAADCIRENSIPVSVVISNLIVLQKADTFPKDLNKDFFKRPTPVDPSELKTVREIMEALRSPNNGTANLLIDKMSSGWAFKKAPPADIQKQVKTNKPFVKNPNHNRVKKTTAVVQPTIVVKKVNNI